MSERRWAFAVLLLILGCAAIVPSACAAGRAECRTVPSAILHRAVPYCVLLPPSYDADTARRYPILYFLHGAGENEQALLNSGGWDAIQYLWDQRQIGEFVVATPSADNSFYVNSHDGLVRYEDFFIREFIPFIESHYRIRAERRYRGISGFSMGGYGALRLAFRHPDLFSSVSAHSAALVEKLPGAADSDPHEVVLARILSTAFGSPLDRAFWGRENPFTLARNGPHPRGLRIYFDCGTEDEFGFDAGAQAFHNLLVSRGIPHEFHLYPGGHNWTYFAGHLPASLEFHSRVFALPAPR